MALITLRAPKTPLGKALAIFPFGIIFLGISYINYQDEKILSSGYTIMKGKVERIHSRSNSRYVTYTVAGSSYQVRTGWLSPYKDAALGDEVEVMVSNTDPSNASINSTYDQYGVIVITAVTGLAIILLGAFVLRRNPGTTT